MFEACVKENEEKKRERVLKSQKQETYHKGFRHVEKCGDKPKRGNVRGDRRENCRRQHATRKQYEGLDRQPTVRGWFACES
jgi:hypothetical protein